MTQSDHISDGGSMEAEDESLKRIVSQVNERDREPRWLRALSWGAVFLALAGVLIPLCYRIVLAQCGLRLSDLFGAKGSVPRPMHVNVEWAVELGGIVANAGNCVAVLAGLMGLAILIIGAFLRDRRRIACGCIVLLAAVGAGYLALEIGFVLVGV